MSFLRRRLVEPLLALLKQGTSPERLSLSIAFGVTLGVFPILGSTTLLCFAAGVVFRLNHPALQLINYVVYPLQIPLILVFVRLGENLLGASPMTFSPLALADEFRAGPAEFLKEFGLTGLRAVFAWSVVSPWVGAILYVSALPALRRAAKVFA